VGKRLGRTREKEVKKMKFNKIIGHTENQKIKDMIKQAEDKLSSIFTELSLGFTNKSLGTGIGGDPLTFQLVYPLPHLCDIVSIQLDELVAKDKDLQEKIKSGEIDPEQVKISPEQEAEEKEFRRMLGKKALRTAATDGRRFYWNPEFVVKQSRMGLRIVVSHESLHALFMHSGRRGSRLPQLWNIAVDYKVNFIIMEDLKAREVKDYAKVFTDNLGEYILLEEYAAFLKDPFHPPPRLAHLNPTEALKSMADPAYKSPYDDKPPMYFAEPNLSADMKRPENIYEYLMAQIPKCPKCGRLGKYKKPDEYKQLEKKIKENEEKEQKAKDKNGQGKDKKDGKGKKGEKGEKGEKGKGKQKGQKGEQGDQGENGHHDCNDPNHQHGEDGQQCDHDHDGEGQEGNGKGNQPSDQQGKNSGQGGDCCDENQCDSGCSECGGNDSEYVNPFIGDTLDDHMDADVSEEELGKRITDAMEMAKRMSGKVPGALEDELGKLIAPKITWQDLVRQVIKRKRNGYGKSDYTRPRNRPLFAGLYLPKKRDIHLNFLAAYDCSGSMSQEDIAFGVSQLQVIDEKGEGYLLPWDSGDPYYEDMVKIKKANMDELIKAKVKGRGGTCVSKVFDTYEEHCGKVDLLIIITDGFLYDGELSGIKIPPKETTVLWLVTSHNPNFKPKVGRVLHLRNE
jgi:predicted metal-dependent peptidase